MTNIRNKQRPFRMLKYLYENTDENHPVSTPELVKIFQAEDAHASRKTVKDDIDVLIGEGFDIVTVRSTQNSFFLANRKFEIPEIKLLIDAVSSSRFINKEKDAINEGKKISFQYFEYNGAKEKLLRRDGAKYSVSPYALVWDDNHYYMLGFSDDRQRMVNYRVDRMCNTEMTGETAVPMPAGFDMEEYVQHQFRMFAGEEVEVVLECRNDMMKYIVDQFGEDVETRKASEETFFAKVSVADSPTFYGWVFPFEGKVKISEPQEIRDKYMAMVRAAAEQVKE